MRLNMCYARSAGTIAYRLVGDCDAAPASLSGPTPKADEAQRPGHIVSDKGKAGLRPKNQRRFPIRKGEPVVQLLQSI